jgi:hypothetical protein
MQDTMTYLIIIGAAVVALAALAALVNYVVSIVHGFQRTPPLPEDMAKNYATKRELAAEIAELKQENREERARVDAILKQQFDLIRKLSEDTFERFSGLMESLKEWQLGIERMIGRIEGKVNTK